MNFNFKSFLRKYNQEIVIIEQTAGHWNTSTGQWVPGTETATATLATVVPLTNDELLHEEAGRYTADDRKMYYHGDIQLGLDVIVGSVSAGTTYLVDRLKDYSHHATGLKMYMLVRKGESA